MLASQWLRLLLSALTAGIIGFCGPFLGVATVVSGAGDLPTLTWIMSSM